MSTVFVTDKSQIEALPVGTLMVDFTNGDSYRVGLLNFSRAIFTQRKHGAEGAPPVYLTDIVDNFSPLMIVWNPED